jgi:hypothetical protein
LLAPSAWLFARHWDVVRIEERAHFSDLNLAAIWMNENAPENAIVLLDGPPLALPYYSRRGHVVRSGDGLRIFRDRGRFTPLNADAYETLSAEGLEALIAAGRPVFAFGGDPLSGLGEAFERRFRWIEAARIDLTEAARSPIVPERIRNQVAEGEVALYRAEIVDRVATQGAPPPWPR